MTDAEARLLGKHYGMLGGGGDGFGKSPSTSSLGLPFPWEKIPKEVAFDPWKQIGFPRALLPYQP